MVRRLPKVVCTGNMTIGGVEVQCAVLEGEQRVITQMGFLQAIGRHENQKGGSTVQPDKPLPFLTADNLQPYIHKRFPNPTNLVRFQSERGGGRPAIGYPAEMLPAVCNAILDARDAGVLRASQQPMAEQADILIRGLATVGVVALVDEATGYQAIRKRDALNRILEAYIAKELMPWTKRFPDEFYIQMFRLRNWPYDEEGFKRRPGYVGYLTTKLVYDKLAPGVLEELKRKNRTEENGRKRLHQFLTSDVGHPHLQRQVDQVTVLMKISDSWTGFMAQFAKAFPTEGTQIYMDVDDDEFPPAAAAEQTPKN